MQTPVMIPKKGREEMVGLQLRSVSKLYGMAKKLRYKIP
jgi:hypothetical protein